MKDKIHSPSSDSRSFSVAAEFLSAIGSDLLAAAVDKDATRLVTASMDFSCDYSVSDFRDRWWACEAFSKLPFDIPDVNREETAFQAFWDAEERCRQANASLIEFESRPNLNIFRLKRARSIVHSILGDFSWDECEQYFSFGPGATTSLRRREASRHNKWEFGTHITEPCLPLGIAFCRRNPVVGDLKFQVVDGNTVTTVPKNAKTDRVIAIEPDWNMFFQRGIGGLIRRRLNKRVRLLTPDAQLLHQQLARKGSRDGSLATIDLKSASDSVSLALCEQLLPEPWFRALMITRSHKGKIQGKVVTYEKVSSMGNGFTFELETLLFYALARACCNTSETLSVYGDDIVVSTRAAEEVISLLQSVGFTINEAKSFVSGDFRESCGGHYYRGHDVTPPYFRDKITDSLAQNIALANKVKRVASQRYGIFLDSRLKPLWQNFASRVPRSLYGPEYMGDAVLSASFDQARPQRYKRFQAFRQEGLVPVIDHHGVGPRSVPLAERLGAYLTSLYGKDVTQESHHVSVVANRYVRKKLRTPVYQWEDGPVWLPAGSL